MNWSSLNYNFWQTLVTFGAIVAAYLVGRKQNEINSAIHRTQDVVELFATSSLRIDLDEKQTVIRKIPFIHIQNVGTRLIYLERYIFNGSEYQKNDQILPSTYSQALNNYYSIELPINGNDHVSLEVFYHDIESRSWKSRVFANLVNGFWQIETLPREIAE